MNQLPKPMISKFRSDRVKSFAGHCLQILCSRIGYGEINEMQLSLLVNYSNNLSATFEIMKDYYPLKHHGEYGELEKGPQRELNFELALSEICGKSTDEKKKLIEDVIRQNDTNIEKSQIEKIKEKFIRELIIGIELIDQELNAFLIKISNLYSVQKNELRRLIQYDSEYENTMTSLSNIFKKHIKRALNLSHH